MKFFKVYIGIIIGFFVVALAVGIYVWYVVQRINTEAGAVRMEPQTQEEIIESWASEKEEKPVEDLKVSEQTESKKESNTQETENIEATAQSSYSIEVDSIPEKQREILRAFGYTDATITVTAEMIQCTEDKIGKDRYNEILSGVAPTPLEALSLAGCFAKN